MADNSSQTYANHARFVPAYHYVAAPLLLVNLLWSLYRVVVAYSTEALFGLILAVGVLIIGLYARVFALKAQDRVIRLEERMRMHEVLPDDLKPRIGDLTTSQLIAMRFAPDDEVPELTRKILGGELTDQKSIKQAISSWRPDYQRV